MTKNKAIKKHVVKYALYSGKRFIKNIVFNNVTTVENTEIILNNIINKTIPLNEVNGERTVKTCNS